MSTDQLSALAVRPGPPLAEADLPPVSIIIASCDGRAHLEGCLPALERSAYPRDRLEVLVVDNGSRDGSLPWLARRWPQVRVLANQENRGFAPACNQGAGAVDPSRVLVFLNNDVRVEPAWLRELVSPIARGECQSTGSRMLLPDGGIDYAGGGGSFQGFAIGHGFGGDSRAEVELARRCFFACGGAMAVERTAFDEVGGFDSEFFAYYDDLDLGWRLWLTGHEVHYVPGAICVHHRSSTSSTFPPEAIRLLQVRNAACSCFKCYDQESLERVLPALLALGIRRSWIMARIEDDSPFRIEGARGRRVGGWRRWLERMRGAQRHPLPSMAVADLLALNDFLGSWDHWSERRAQVQSRRRRGDREIFELFLRPLWCVEGEREYAELQQGLVARYGLEEMFGSS